jgi:hypothetical protein
MEIDAYFQGFEDGGEAHGGGRRMREVLAPHVVGEEPEHGYLRVGVGDAGADVYLDDDHMLVNHAHGDRVWDLLLTGARSADWVALAPERPVCLVDEGQRAHLPPDYDTTTVVVVTSGAELAAALLTPPG